MNEQSYDEQAEFYDEMMPSLDSQSQEIACYARLLGDRNSIIEFGCGTGRITLPLIDRLRSTGSITDYLATDRSTAMINVARSKIIDRSDGDNTEPTIRFDLVDAAGEGFQLDEGGFDAAIALCGLTSLLGREQVATFFANAFRTLNPGGILIVDWLDPKMVNLSAAVVNGTFLRVTEFAGLASFTRVRGASYEADFVWVSGQTARRFSERSDLIPPCVMNGLAASAGFTNLKEESRAVREEIAEINGPVMNFGVYSKH